MTSSHLEVLARALSRLLGWIYFFSWSASFYPQPITNYRRKSTVGVSIDFTIINFLGFLNYTIYTASFLYSSTIQAQYAARYSSSEESTVRFNDFAFAAHAVLLCALMYTQFWPSIWGFQVTRSQRISRPMAGLLWGSILAPLLVGCIVLARSPDRGYDPLSWAWIDVIYALSFVKVLVTVFKYVPQAWLNYKRQSTVGWSIVTILLDLNGGILSLLQLVLDSSLQNDWSGITGNPVKLLLGNVTIIFDFIFIVQHYILYRSSPETNKQLNEDDDVTAPLLGDANSQQREGQTEEGLSV